MTRPRPCATALPIGAQLDRARCCATARSAPTEGLPGLVIAPIPISVVGMPILRGYGPLNTGMSDA